MIDIPQAIWDQLVKTLNDWLSQVPNSTAVGVETILFVFINWIKTLSFITNTPLDLVNVLSDKIGLDQIVPLLNAATATALLFAAVAFAGHYAFGWPGIGYTLQKIGVAIILVKISQQATDWSLQLFDGLSRGIASAMPDFPDLQGVDPIGLILLLAIWLILFFRVAIVAGKRIAWLALLKPLAGLAFLTYLHQKSSWIGSMWVELWVGWLIGQIFLVLAITLSVLFVAQGGFLGYVLSCAALMVAHDAVQILTPKGGPPLVSVGPIKI
jgi:hypothetical protein